MGQKVTMLKINVTMISAQAYGLTVGHKNMVNYVQSEQFAFHKRKYK